MAREMGQVQRTIKALLSKEFADAEKRLHQPAAPLGWESSLRWGLVGTCLTFSLFGVGLIMPPLVIGIMSLALAWIFLVFTLMVVLRDLGPRAQVILTVTASLLAGWGMVQIVRHSPQSE